MGKNGSKKYHGGAGGSSIPFPPPTSGLFGGGPPIPPPKFGAGFNFMNSIYDNGGSDPFGFGSNNLDHNENKNKFTIDEIEDLEDGFFEWTQNSNELEQMNILDIGIFLDEEGIQYSKLKLQQWIYDKVKPSSYITFNQFLTLINTDVVKSSGHSMSTGPGFGGMFSPDSFHNISKLMASKSATLMSIQSKINADDSEKVFCLEGHIC